MKKFLLIFFSLVSCLALLNCQGGSSSFGGSEAGNPPDTRPVNGQLSAKVSNAAHSDFVDYDVDAVSSCPADSVLALESNGNTTITEVSDNCTFTLNLMVDRAYAIHFVLGDTFIASMVFNNGLGALTSSVMIVSSGPTPIELGLITILGFSASPQNQPATQNDQDDDGIYDFDDDDDDGDGVFDDDEEDCDFDGYWDDYDDDFVCDEVEGVAVILEVYPHGDNSLDDGFNLVDLDETIEVRFSCDVKLSTVTSSTFRVTDDVGGTVLCDFSSSNSDTVIKCDHDQDFKSDTVYEITVDGVQCVDGREILSDDWQWKTVP